MGCFLHTLIFRFNYNFLFLYIVLRKCNFGSYNFINYSNQIILLSKLNRWWWGFDFWRGEKRGFDAGGGGVEQRVWWIKVSGWSRICFNLGFDKFGWEMKMMVGDEEEEYEKDEGGRRRGSTRVKIKMTCRIKKWK